MVKSLKNAQHQLDLTALHPTRKKRVAHKVLQSWIEVQVEMDRGIYAAEETELLTPV